MRKFVFILVPLLAFLFVFFAFAYNGEDENPEALQYPLRIVTTVGMVADMVTNVGGDWVQVQSLMGPGVDPHLYKASAGDISKMDNATYVFYVGLELEGKMEKVLEKFSGSGRGMAISDSVSHEKLLAAQATMTGTYDPHIWFDVSLWAETVRSVEDALTLLDPEHEQVYRENADNYRHELLALDAWVREQILMIPAEQRVMITAHDAFNYFGKAYDIEVYGVQGISTASDYGLKDLEWLIDLIVDRKIQAIFVETSVSGKSIEALREGVRARGHTVAIGGTLFSDAMGDPGTPEGTYLGMVKANVKTIFNALTHE